MVQIDIDLIRLSRFRAPSEAEKPNDEELRFAEETAILTPVLVRRVGTPAFPSYELLGEDKSWFIAQQLMLPKVPAVVLSLTDAEAKTLVALRRRARSEDPIQWAQQAQTYIEKKRRYRRRYSLTDAAKDLGIERSRLSHALRMLKRLHPDVKSALSTGVIKIGHARRLASLSFTEQLRLTQRIRSQGLSVRAVEATVAQQLSGTHSASADESAERPSYLTRLEIEVSEVVGAKTRLAYDERTRSGEVILAFQSLEQLEGLLERLGWRSEGVWNA